MQKMSLKVLTTKYGSKYFPSKQGLYYNKQKHLKFKNLFEFKILGSNDFQKAEIIKRASKYQADIQITITLIPYIMMPLVTLTGKVWQMESIFPGGSVN